MDSPLEEDGFELSVPPSEGTYQPQPVKRVEIPKPDGGVRKLQAFERAFFVRTHQQRSARHIGGEDHGEAAGLAHFRFARR